MPGAPGALTGGSMGAGASVAAVVVVAALVLAAVGTDGAGGITDPDGGGLGTVVGTVALAGEPGC